MKMFPDEQGFDRKRIIPAVDTQANIDPYQRRPAGAVPIRETILGRFIEDEDEPMKSAKPRRVIIELDD